MCMMCTMLQGTSAFTVVIDAGHGGKDPGALGAITREKDLNLDVSLRLAKLIEQQDKDVSVYLTRKTDVFLTLQERADFVNKRGADLFICIHTNSAQNKSVHGAETYTLGLHKQESNLSVAMRENAVMMLEDDYQTKYQGFDPNSVESYIMFEFMQDQYMDRSLQFASLVQQQLSNACRRTDKGVRQAGFWVLHKSACPSVLIEMGFISNAEEEKYLASKEGKDEVAQAIYDAFAAYKAAVEKRERVSENAKSASENTESETSVQPASQERETVKNEEKKSTSEEGKANSAEEGKRVYRVQIFAVSSVLPEGDATFKGLKGCKYTQAGKLYKYTYGEESDYGKITELQQELRRKFADCFIVAFEGNRQVPVK